MKQVAFLLVLTAGFVSAQSPSWVPCFLPTPGVVPVYFMVPATSPASPFTQCEQVVLDPQVTNPPIRDTTGKLHISAIAGVPAHQYTTVVQWPFTAAPTGTFYADPPNTTPASPFNGQPIWCASTASAALQSFVAQLNVFLPAMLIEMRLAGTATPVLTTTGVLSAVSPSNGGRYLWVPSASQCGNNPALVFTAAASSIVVGGSTVNSSLLSITVVGLL